MLDKDLIPNPADWRLIMRIDRDVLHVMAFSPREYDSLIYRALPLDRSATSRLKAIEDVVYDNPMLLNDFGRVDCLVSTPRYIITPDDDTPVDDAFALMRKMFPSDTHCDISANGMGGIYMQVEEDVLRFLRRTFAGINISHPLVPLIKYFTGPTVTGSGNGRSMFVSFQEDRVDVVATSHGQLLMANSCQVTGAPDIVYYILASRQQLGFSAENDPILTTGDSPAREEAIATLRRYVRHVMPVIFPSSMFRCGKDAMAAPFDLIALPLSQL